MLDKRLKEIGLSLIGASFFYLAFSKFSLGFLLPLYLFILGRYKSFFLWFLSGFLSFFFSLLWIRIAMIDYGGVFPPLVYLLIIILSLSLSLFQFGLTYLLWRLVRFSPFLLPLLWTCVELLRSNFPYGGFPWLIVGEVLVDLPFLKRYLAVGGVYLGSLALWFLSLSPMLVRVRKGFTLLAVLLLLPLLLQPPQVKKPHGLKVAIIQPNVDVSDKLVEERFYKHLPSYWQLLEEVLREGPDIVLLPESAFPFTGNQIHSEGKKLLDYSHRATIITGIIDLRYSDRWEPYNSVFVIRDGEVVDFYDKVKLLPFGEYVPFPFGFVKGIFDAIGGLDYVPGSEPRCLRVNGVSLGTPICFEVSYSWLVRRMARCSELLAVLTNDGWFRDSDGTFQHLRHARVRAVETARFLLWVNNTGPSGVISPEGKVIEEIPYGKAGYILFEF